jgi:hypothetical protein
MTAAAAAAASGDAAFEEAAKSTRLQKSDECKS